MRVLIACIPIVLFSHWRLPSGEFEEQVWRGHLGSKPLCPYSHHLMSLNPLQSVSYLPWPVYFLMLCLIAWNNLKWCCFYNLFIFFSSFSDDKIMELWSYNLIPNWLYPTAQVRNTLAWKFGQYMVSQRGERRCDLPLTMTDDSPTFCFTEPISSVPNGKSVVICYRPLAVKPWTAYSWPVLLIVL